MRTDNIQKEQLWLVVAAQAVLLLILTSGLIYAFTANSNLRFRAQTATLRAETSLAPDVLVAQAESQIANDNIPGGIALLDVTIQQGQPSARVFGARAAAYVRIGDITNAIYDYQQATALAPDNGDYQFGLCFTQVQAGQFQQALPACTNAIQIMPDHFMAWNNRCYIRAYHSGDYQGAIGDCTQAIALDSLHPFPYNNRARANLMTGSYQQAITDATQSIMLGNAYPHLPLTNRGTAYLALGNAQTALRDFQAAIDANPNYDEVYARLGELYRWQNQPQLARQAYCQYLNLSEAPLQLIIDRVNEYGGCG